MRLLAGVMLIGVLVSSVFGQAIPPINLQAELLQAGEVSLTWEAPPDGLFEDFNDGVAQGFEWLLYNGSYVIEDGYAKVDVTSNVSGQWGTGVYTPVVFDDFTAEVTYEGYQGYTSRGMVFRCDGNFDSNFNGYGFWTSNSMFSVWKYVNGSESNAYPWTTSTYINTGTGEPNTLKITAEGSTYTLYINDQQVATFSDATHSSGHVGVVAAYGDEIWFDELTSVFGILPGPDSLPGEPGEPLQGEFNSMGQPLNAIAVAEQQAMMATLQSGNASGGTINEIDEFVEYRVYRDGAYRGSSTTEAYTDNLPQPGEYEYTVTAYYDPEGESSPAGPLLLNWEPVVLTLTGQVTTVPPEGGLIYYDVSIWNTLPQNFPNVNWWTTVILPNGQNFGPLAFQNVTIPGFLNTTIQGLNQNIPELAPAGTYTFIGHVGYYPNSVLNDSFTFEKQGVNAEAIPFDPADWTGTGLTIAGEAENAISLPAAYALSAAYPNPFNPSTSFSVSLPGAAELTVTVYNIAGQRVATLADGMTSAGQHEFTFDASGLASGLYFVQAVVPGQMNQIRKVTLLR